MFKHSILRHLLSSCAFAAPEGAGGSRPAKPKASVPAAGKSPFAHLARNAPKAAEDDKDDDKDKDAAKDDGEEDDEEDDDKKTKKAKKAKKAKADDDDADSEDSDDDASAEEDDDDDDKKKSSKKSKKAEDGDDDSDKDDDDDPEARAARARERGRITAIVTSGAGILNPVAAMELACGTSMPRRQAVGLLKAMGAGASSEPKKTDALRNRMSGVDAPDIGAGDGGSPAPAGSAQATAAAIVAAGKKRRGEKA